MTRNYTALVGKELAEKLRNAGFPQQPMHNWYGPESAILPFVESEECVTAPYFSEVFDWLMDKRISIEVYSVFELDRDEYRYLVDNGGHGIYSPDDSFGTWPEAATAAVEEAIEILNEK